jgi:hypothetical protein
MMTRMRWLAPSLLTLALTACQESRQPAERSNVGQASEGTSGGVVDSVIPIAVALERFRADLPPPAVLQSGAPTRDALVRQVVEALEAADTAAFEPLAVNRAEWAWLFYPTSALAQPPYELPPALAWFQRQEQSRKGVLRALREFEGHALEYGGYSCDPDPTIEATNRSWTGCRVTLSRDGGEPLTLRLFGGILERDGRFAILSYANDL